MILDLAAERSLAEVFALSLLGRLRARLVLDDERDGRAGAV